MASTYYTPTPASGKQNEKHFEGPNAEEHEPVLNDEDEKFLSKQISTDNDSDNESMHVAPAKITDDGEVEEATREEQEQVSDNADQVVIPETQPEATEGASYDEVMKQKAAERVKARKEKKRKSMELPSQEEAEAATRGFYDQAGREDDVSPAGKRSWKSYLPSVGKKANSAKETDEADSIQRTWTQYTQYAASHIPNLSSISITRRSKEPDAKPETVYNEDGTVNETATKEKQEREISDLLSNLNLNVSGLNNRVFALSAETQKLYDRFAQVLKDTINGAPTAYEDMDKFFHEFGPKLEQQFKVLPPFLQTLVKSLPAKLGTTLGPELMVAASEKPGADLKARQAASSSDANASTTGETSANAKKKSKRRIPGLKSLLSKEGAVATMLRNVVTFLQTRFPFLASTTNIVMSLAVFILMFVLWYCHKRGKEVRLAREAEGDDVVEVDGSEDDDEGDSASGDDETNARIEKDVDEKADLLNQPDPREVPLPGNDSVEDVEKGEKGL